MKIVKVIRKHCRKSDARTTSYDNSVVSEEYEKYLEENGLHFTDKLAEWASRQMKTDSKEQRHWSTEEIKEEFVHVGLNKPEENTWGDVCYLANMMYSDYYGKSIDSENDCIKQAHAFLTDIDGYPEKAFVHWCKDVEHKGEVVDWSIYL